MGGFLLNEKALAVLGQYDLTILSVRRGRGSFLVETDQGLKRFEEYSGTDGRLKFQNRVLAHLRTEGFRNVDLVLPNREGGLCSADKDETRYIVKDWYEGRECDVNSLPDVLASVRVLAALHKQMRLPREEGEGYGDIPLLEELERKMRELRKVRKFIRTRRGKNEFEQQFLDLYGIFEEEAEKTMEELRTGGGSSLYEKSFQEGCIVHGDYNHHHILFLRKGEAVTDFGRCHYGVQVGDFCQFLRKVLEKRNWDQEYGRRMIREYQKIRPLDGQEYLELKLRLQYPEKFWKLANHYFASNKAWLPKKNTEKLFLLKEQQKTKADFLKMLE